MKHRNVDASSPTFHPEKDNEQNSHKQMEEWVVERESASLAPEVREGHSGKITQTEGDSAM